MNPKPTLDTSRVPPDVATLRELLQETLATLQMAVRNYQERGEVVLMGTVATALRKLCHVTAAQTPLLQLLEQHGESVPEFLDASSPNKTGFSIEAYLDEKYDCLGIDVVSSLDEATLKLPWRAWWKATALCLPADKATGWQGGRLPVSREQLATEWANRYGGAHVDVRGPERWLTELVQMEQLGFWTSRETSSNNQKGVELVWFEQTRDQGEWRPLKVHARALGHLVLGRMAAEVVKGYGMPVPTTLTVEAGSPKPPNTEFITRIRG